VGDQITVDGYLAKDVPRWPAPERLRWPTAGACLADRRSTETPLSSFSRRSRQRKIPQHISTERVYQNFTIVLRVSVTWPVTTAGPPLNRCQAAYCSMYGSSDDRQSIGTITL
jgi:hypothetical protein